MQLIDAGNAPLPNRPVTFTVRRNDGIVKSAIAQNEEVTVTTDADGRASVGFQLGTRSGVGNNTVLVTASGFAGEMMFSASAGAGAPSSIKGAMLRNDTQYGIVGKPLAQSYQVIVVDEGGNPVINSPVIFNVEAGGGNIEGQGSVTKNTDADGKASVTLTLGMQEGVNNNVVTATFDGFTGDPVSFLASGQTLGAATDTRIVGVVLDMQNRPIPHAEVKVVGCALCPTDLTTFTDAQGQFAIPNAPVGALTLFVDGETTTRPEEFPHLTYQFTTIAGQDNTVGRPIQLPMVNVAATKIVGGNEDVVLTMTGVPGVAFTVSANSARTASGEKYVGPLTLSQVSSDKAPMPLPNNSAPQVVWTLQPANIHFDKPIQVQLPNTTGMPPSQVVEARDATGNRGRSQVDLTATGLTATTNAQGEFNFNALPVDTYTLTARETATNDQGAARRRLRRKTKRSTSTSISTGNPTSSSRCATVQTTRSPERASSRLTATRTASPRRKRRRPERTALPSSRASLSATSRRRLPIS